jgi:phenylalanyl-tRNA synthetase alpha chain
VTQTLVDDLGRLQEEALAALEGVSDEATLEEWRVSYLGRRGPLNTLLRSIGDLAPEERPAVGARGNEIRRHLEERFEERARQVRSAAVEKALIEGAIDVTLPGRTPPIGRLHPTTKMLREICSALVSMGFQVVEGPEVESDYYNFQALNIPEEHPARDMWDTLWLDPDQGMLLRTQTSNVQIRVLERLQPPIRIVSPGRVYRNEATDATHEAIFFQVEGLVVDEGVTFAQLKGTLATLLRRLFGAERKVDFRGSYFPFVEPGIEVAMDCFRCNGAGCRTCGESGWLEVLGAGMVHPKVLSNTGHDPNRYTGYAFGMGVERLAMLKYGIEDIRLFYSNDLRFLKQL